MDCEVWRLVLMVVMQGKFRLDDDWKILVDGVEQLWGDYDGDWECG